MSKNIARILLVSNAAASVYVAQNPSGNNPIPPVLWYASAALSVWALFKG